MSHYPIMSFLKLFCAGLLISVSSLMASAQLDEGRLVQSTWMIGVGSSHLADTYLSPLKYSGWSLGLAYDRTQVSRWSERWVTHLKAGVDLDRTLNPVGNAVMWAAQLQVSWGMIRKWEMPAYGINFGVGPAIRLEGGCLYNARNSNNPASAKATATIDLQAFVSKSVRLRGRFVNIRYQPTLPVIGAFFSPKYDELYYELYLGNHSGLVHPAWWGNRFKLDNLVTADIWLGSTALRLGYECSVMTSKVSNLTTRMITHRFVVGITLNWLALRPSENSISPL